MRYPKLWPDEVEQRIRKEARNLDPQTTPDEVVMCKKCVVTNQRPRIVFDEEGVCSACRYMENQAKVDWDAREQELIDLLERHRTVGRYDAIVPCSGGKDSSFVASTLRDRYAMRPLCATWAPHIYTDIGWKNFQSFIHHGFDVVMAQPNGLLHRKLARLAFEFYGDPFQPFVYGQLAWPMHVASQNDVGLVFFGENGEAAYGGDPSANEQPCWDEDHWERVYLKGAGVERLLRLGVDLGAIHPTEAEQASPFYRLPDIGAIHAQERPEFHWLGYYLRWHPQHNFYHASEVTGFEANEERSEGTYSKYASLDDKLDGLHYYMAYVKFGIGRCTSDAAHEVRDGDLERDEALALVERYDGEFPKRHLTECMSYLGLMAGPLSDLEYLQQIIERFRGPQVSLNRAA